MSKKLAIFFLIYFSIGLIVQILTISKLWKLYDNVQVPRGVLGNYFSGSSFYTVIFWPLVLFETIKK